MTALGTRTAFGALFDDAAIFPPGNLPLPDAVRAHRGYAGDPTVGAFVCSAARLGELDELLDAPLDVALVVPAGPVALPPLRHARLVAVERHEHAQGTTPEVVTYVEFATVPSSADALAQVARVKFRTGGTTAAAFPTEAALAERDGPSLAVRWRALDEAQVRDVRAAFVSFGTCSIAEPTADLRDLGLLA